MATLRAWKGLLNTPRLQCVPMRAVTFSSRGYKVVGLITTLPAPELLVVIVGGVEIGAALSLFLNRIPWLGAFLAVPIMTVAIATAGPSWQNVSVLLAGVLLVGTERRVLGAVR